MTEPHLGIVRGHGIELIDAAMPFAEGTKVLVTPLPAEAGAAEALLAAMAAGPRVTAEDVALLEAEIAAGRRQRKEAQLFDESR